ncbi:hypothetical protein ABK040_012286 [Willaertia magna]
MDSNSTGSNKELRSSDDAYELYLKKIQNHKGSGRIEQPSSTLMQALQSAHDYIEHKNKGEEVDPLNTDYVHQAESINHQNKKVNYE